MVEGIPGEVLRCSECGFEAPAPTKAESTGPEASAPPPKTEPVPNWKLIAPFAYIAGVIAIGTFYLAQFYIPFIFGIIAVSLGLYARFSLERTVQSTIAISLGAAGLLLALIDIAFL